MFQVTNVEQGLAGIFEPLGTKAKFWYDENRHMFKFGRPDTGENWAEVVAATIAEGLGLPHASYSLAVVETGRQGVTTPNFVPKHSRLVLGNELIGVVSSHGTAARQDRRQSHTVRRVSALLGTPIIQTPLDWVRPTPTMTASGVMAGYLMLDALIGNQDRHEENWGLIAAASKIYLAPTFDHASSLGRNESDEVRTTKLAAQHPAHSVAGYASKANSQLFNNSGHKLRTVDAFVEFSAAVPEAAKYWQMRLRRLDELFFRLVLDRVPVDWISEPAREFAVAILQFNRRRLLELEL